MTARDLFHQCRTAGIALAEDGDGIAFDAPPGVAVPVDDLRACKAELLAVLRGDYLNAAAALVQRVAGHDEWEDLAYEFDERAGICQYDGGMSRGEAERHAYIAMAKTVGKMGTTHTRNPVPVGQSSAGKHDSEDCTGLTCKQQLEYGRGKQASEVERPDPPSDRFQRNEPLRHREGNRPGPIGAVPLHGRDQRPIGADVGPVRCIAQVEDHHRESCHEDRRTVNHGDNRQ